MRHGSRLVVAGLMSLPILAFTVQCEQESEPTEQTREEAIIPANDDDTELAATPDTQNQGCKGVGLKAPTFWVGSAVGEVVIRTGPGADYPLHESGNLLSGEEVQVLHECEDWVQARAIPPHLIDAAIEQHGRGRAKEMLLFWVRKKDIRRTN